MTVWRRNKFRNQPMSFGELSFASKREAKRWGELNMLQAAGVIRNLKRQVPFKLVVDGDLIKTWRADFSYFEGNRAIVEDVKSPYLDRTNREWILTKKLFAALYRGYELRVTY